MSITNINIFLVKWRRHFKINCCLVIWSDFENFLAPLLYFQYINIETLTNILIKVAPINHLVMNSPIFFFIRILFKLFKYIPWWFLSQEWTFCGVTRMNEYENWSIIKNKKSSICWLIGTCWYDHLLIISWLISETLILIWHWNSNIFFFAFNKKQIKI